MPRIILDTDLAMGAPGSDIDDGFALALAHAYPDIQLDLVTTVNGNTDVESATLLTLELRRRLGLPDRSLLAPLVEAAGLAYADGRVGRPGDDRDLRPAEAGMARLEAHLAAEPFAAPERPELDAWGLGVPELSAICSAVSPPQ